MLLYGRWSGEGSKEMFEKIGVLTCNLVPHMPPFEVKFVIFTPIFRSKKEESLGWGRG